MSIQLYFLSNGMTIIADQTDVGNSLITLRHAYEIFVTPDDTKLRFTMVPAFTVYGMLEPQEFQSIPVAAVIRQSDPTTIMIQHYETKRAQGETA
jgi:hypothetical protein